MKNQTHVVIKQEPGYVYTKKLGDSDILLERVATIHPFGHHPAVFGFLLYGTGVDCQPLSAVEAFGK